MEKLLIKFILLGIYFLGFSSEGRVFPEELRPTELGIDSRIEVPDDNGGGSVVESPKFGDDWICGFEHVYDPHQKAVMKLKDGIQYFPQFENYGENSEYKVGDLTFPHIYYLNETAEKLAAEGFNIKVNQIGFGDVLCNFTFSNGTFEDTYAYVYINHNIPVGREAASVVKAYYMAQIGEKKNGKIEWLCDGVLINHRWILTAAHCFTQVGVNPNIVRLGDLDKDDFKDPPLNRYHEFIRDYPIEQLVPYPDFKINERYHDLILIQIPRPIPISSGAIFPICLPWGKETNKDLVGTNVTLSGRGATYYSPKTSRLQEVNLTVFETSICDKAYHDIPQNQRIYPQGITKDKLLCVGSKENGRDACGGYPGAPIVYLKETGNHHYDLRHIREVKQCGTDTGFTDITIHFQEREYVLAGIVSKLHGCDLKDFPSLYIPINKPNYLQWIKDVAFKEYV